MKTTTLILLLLAALVSNAQKFTYTYDAAGNRTGRILVLDQSVLKSEEIAVEQTAEEESFYKGQM